MSTPTVLDVQDALTPIPGDNPSGESLAYEPAYDELREARRSEDDTSQGDWQRKAKTADWERVIELGMELLKRETKDLQIAAWITEGLGKRHKFAGLRDGFRLLRGLQETFWDTCYPEIDDGDLESRGAPYELLNRVLPTMIRSFPMTSGFGEEQYSYYRYQESRATDNVGLKNPELMETLIAEGKITSRQFDEAVAQSPRRFYETLAEDLKECAESLKALDDSLDQRFGRQSPGLSHIRKAIEDCRVLLGPILNAKRAAEPDASDEEAAPAEETDSETYESESSSWDEEPKPSAPRRRAPARASGGPIADVPDAFERIKEVAAYLRENDPSSPVPFLVVRALRMGEVYGPGQPADTSLCDAPSSTVRMNLKRLMAEGEWDQLLEQVEQALSRTEGRAWLDLHRYALVAMASTYPDRTAAANACKGLLRTFLADYPDLLDAELADGTPTASSETRAWLKDEVLTASAAPTESSSDEYTPPPPMPAYVPVVAPSDDGTPDIWASALELARGGRTPEAIDLVRRAMSTASTGRERFHRKLELAELCLMGNRHHVALPLCEDLARQVDEFHLETWESETLCARVWAAYYRCLRTPGIANGSEEKARQVFARLCRLDINQASTFAADLFG